MQKIKNKIKELFKQDKPISDLQVILTIVFVIALVISNIISSRVFNFFGFSMTSAVIIFPLTYILSDLFSEVYGYGWSRITCYLAFLANLFVVGILALASLLPMMYPGVDIAKTLLGGTFACTIASFIAFVIGDFVNDKIFANMKKEHAGLTNHKGFALRAILSSLAGEFFDSAIYLPLAFLVFNPIMTVSEVVIMVILQVFLKTGYETIILPLTTFFTKKAAKYEFKLMKENERLKDTIIKNYLDELHKEHLTNKLEQERLLEESYNNSMLEDLKQEELKRKEQRKLYMREYRRKKKNLGDKK